MKKIKFKSKFGLLYTVLFFVITITIIITIVFNIYSAKEKKNKTITFIVKSELSTFWELVKNGAKAASNEYNIKFNFYAAPNEEDYKTQNELIEKAINDKDDLIVFSAIDYDKSVQSVKKAEIANIPVIIIDSDINTDIPILKIGTDNYKSGELIYESLVNNTVDKDKVNVVLVNFLKSSLNGSEREKGFSDRAKLNKKIAITKKLYLESNPDAVRKSTIDLIKSDSSIDVIITFNELTTIGVGKAIEKLDKKDIIIYGFDNNVVSLKHLQKGYITSLIIQNPYAMGYYAVKEGVNVLNKKSPKEKKIDTKVVIVDKHNLFDNKHQKIVFPFSTIK